MRHILFAFAFGIALVGAPAAQACSHGTPGLGRIDVPIGAPGHTYYLVFDDETHDQTWWVFEETNGIDALQAGGCSSYINSDCWYACSYYQGTPDTLVT